MVALINMVIALSAKREAYKKSDDKLQNMQFFQMNSLTILKRRKNSNKN